MRYKLCRASGFVASEPACMEHVHVQLCVCVCVVVRATRGSGFHDVFALVYAYSCTCTYLRYRVRRVCLSDVCAHSRARASVSVCERESVCVLAKGMRCYSSSTLARIHVLALPIALTLSTCSSQVPGASWGAFSVIRRLFAL